MSGRLAAVLARALREHRGINGTCPNLSDVWSPTVHDTWEESAEHVVAAIPEPERSALEVGVLLAEVASRGWDVQVYGPHTTGDVWTVGVRLMSDEWHEAEATTLHAALTSLLDRLVAP